MVRSKYIFVITLGLIILGLDQLSKYWLVNRLDYGAEQVIFANFFSLVHYRNEGAAFGILANWDSQFRELFFYALALVAVGFLFSLAKQTRNNDKISLVAIGLIFGGALGNIIDRILRGSVVDFISIHLNNEHLTFMLGDRLFDIALVWPAFNVADSAITVGVVFLMIQMLRSPTKIETT